MANIFDQFDTPPRGANPFDRFDEVHPPMAVGRPPPVQQPESGSYGSQIFSGLLEGATGALGFPVDAANAAIGLGMRGVNAAFGTDFQPSAEPLGGSAGLRRGLAISPPSEDVGPQMARRASQSVGGALVPLSTTARTAGQAAAGIGAAFGGGLGGATAQQLFPDNMGAEIAGELLGGLGTGAAIGGIADRYARRAAERAVPTVDELRARASAQYDAAEARGVVAGPQDTQALAGRVRQIARDNELITPTGRVSGAYPRASEAMGLLDDYSGHPMNPTQMQVIRDTLADARNATDGKERRIASKMLDEFDRFTDPLAPELKTARSLSQRAIKGRQLETLREVAESRAGQYSVSGTENAIRNEYDKLNQRIIRGDEGGWTPSQRAAIARTAEGTVASRAARRVGKLAPKGVVSLGVGGGVPYMIGSSIGGPGLGAAFSAATMGSGIIGNAAATQMRSRYAELAELAARNGGKVMTPSMKDLQRRIFEAILGGQTAIQSNRQSMQ